MRAFTSDSFEDMGSDFTPDFLAAFAARRGYDLRLQLPGAGRRGRPRRGGARAGRLPGDGLRSAAGAVRAPVGGLGHAQGSLARNQAHGAPGNLLDLYAAADIPETEAFGPSHLPIPGLRTEPNLPAHFGKPDTLFSKLASSAAHLAGRPLVSAEAATWLGEHFQVAPSQVKPELDRLFLAGVNHVFLHGVTYSPADAPWPGWLFYASTDFGPESGFWRGDARAVGVRRPHPGACCRPRSPTAICWSTSRCTTCGTEASAEGPAERRLLHLTAHDVGRWLHQPPDRPGARGRRAAGPRGDVRLRLRSPAGPADAPRAPPSSFRARA